MFEGRNRGLLVAKQFALHHFVNDVAEIAEEAHHHPEMIVHYARVKIRLTTHDQGGITELDFELASRIDTLVD